MSQTKKFFVNLRFISVVFGFVFLLALVFSTPKAYAAVEVNSNTFPDPALLSFVKESYDADGDNSLSDGEIAAVAEFNIYNRNIKSLTGVQVFTSCKVVNIRSTDIEYVDLSNMPALKTLYAENTGARTLDVRGCTQLVELNCEESPRLKHLLLAGCSALETISAFETGLESIDLSDSDSLKSLTVSYTYLKELDVTRNTALEHLRFGAMYSEAEFKFPDLSQNVNLRYVDTSFNYHLTEIDVSHNFKLEELGASFCSLSTIDVSNNPKLKTLAINRNNLTYLDLSHNSELEDLSAMWNELTSIDTSNNTKLRQLSCGENKIKHFDLSANEELVGFGCYENGTTSINFGHKPFLKNVGCRTNELVSLDLRGAENLVSISCEENQLQEILFSRTTKLQSIDANNNQLLQITIPDIDSLWYGETLVFEDQTRTIEFEYDGKGALISTKPYKLLNPVFDMPSATYDEDTGYIYATQIGTCKFQTDVDTVFEPTPRMSGVLTFAAKTHTLTFLGQGDKLIASLQIPHGLEMVYPEAPEEEGYEFVGWDKEIIQVTEDVTVRALYRGLPDQDDVEFFESTTYNDENAKAILPQTGDKGQSWLILLACSLAIVGVFGLAVRKVHT